MNSLTINLHLMMASFYRPVGMRDKVLIEAGAFSSDRHAILGQLSWHKLDPEERSSRSRRAPAKRRCASKTSKRRSTNSAASSRSCSGPACSTAPARLRLRAHHARRACAGRHRRLRPRACHRQPAAALHDWDVDFAVWCSYKYLNAGPGAIGGCFVHERHFDSAAALSGWWGHDRKTRFQMRRSSARRRRRRLGREQSAHLLRRAAARLARDVPRRRHRELRAKSVRLTAYAERLLRERVGSDVQVITPAAPEERGCQLACA
jgi:kynureninase